MSSTLTMVTMLALPVIGILAIFLMDVRREAAGRLTADDLRQQEEKIYQKKKKEAEFLNKVRN